MGGSHLLKLKSSYIDLIYETFPEYDWLPWKFEVCPKNFWHDVKNVRRFMDWAGKQLNVQELSDWYNVSFMVLFFSSTNS